MNITEEHIHKIHALLDQGLSSGLGTPEPGKMCIEAAICYALDLPHSDDPGCVAQSVRRLKIRLNDSRWSSNHARAEGMRRLGLIQLGTMGVLDEKEFAKRVARLAIQTCVPNALRAAAFLCKNQEKKDKMLEMADLCEREPTRKNALKGNAAADAAAYVAAADAAAYAADAADDAAADAAAYAADAAAVAAAYAADAAAVAADAAAAYAADAAAVAADAAAAYAADAAAVAADAAADVDAADARDKRLADFCEAVVQILIDMKVPGVKWLDVMR